MTPFRVALLLAVLCGVAAWQVSVIPESMMQMTVGPVLAPGVIVAALSAFAVLYGISAWRGRQADDSLAPDQSPLPGAHIRMLSLLGGGVAFIALVIPLGFVIPGTLCGMGVARAFDAPLNLQSALVCTAIASTFWFVFAQLLGVGLGPALPWLI
ncbi:tripartite tricarboxylate transporter TctB family protein [Limnohabitans sp. 2KL-27]|uniref:tripartite tricarboxylate transporter TctB family protein n=1 Tax=Limnohabitans sp. 2KL-27 TaxID=1100705 RepID=UPI000ABE54BB|nr:tripartite tricarboxylate transporter TctB family protein [Limnohabitans sp. 2KL-27]